MTYLCQNDINEVYRYMGFKDECPDASITKMTLDIMDEISSKATPRFCSINVPVKILGNCVMLGRIKMESESLSKHLKNSDEAIIFAATLGTAVDMLIYKYSMISPSKAVAAQSAATVMLENFADDICKGFLRQAQKEGMNITPRFSAGYGDLDLSLQKDFINILDAAKKIGLALTDSGMLTPVKSITAIVGFSAENQEVCNNKCRECTKADCAFKKLK